MFSAEAPGPLEPLKQPTTFGLILCAMAASGALLALAQYVSSVHGGTVPYLIFWLAYALVVIPLGWMAVRRGTGDKARTVLIVTLAGWSVIPVWIRTGYRMLYADDFQSYRLLENIATLGKPVISHNILAIGGTFPGLEYFTYGVHVVTSLSLLASAFVAAVVSHASEVVGAYALCSALTRSRRAGAIGAMVFFLNPSFLFFDAEYAYETLSISLLLWGFFFAYLAVTGGASESLKRRRKVRWQCGALSIALSTAILFTHHVSSAFNAVALVIFAIVVTLSRRFRSVEEPESVVMAWLIGGFALITTTIRYVEIHSILGIYLAPVINFGSQFSQILHFIGIGSGGANRSPFDASSAPWFEIISAYLMVPILLVAFVGALFVLWRQWRTTSSFVIVGTLIGLLFFVSVPLTTSRDLVETAHRSWAYSFIGLAILVAAAAEPFFAKGLVAGKRQFRLTGSPRHTFVTCVTVLACVMVVAMGSVTSGTSTSYRFATKATPGDDPNEINTQTTMVRNYFVANHYEGQGLLVDRMVSHQLDILPDSYMVLNQFIIPLTFYNKLDWYDLIQLRRKDVEYVEVNSEMDKVVPNLGFWYLRTEPLAYTNKLVPAYIIYRYHCFNWMNAVFVTKDLTIYKVSQKELRRDLRHHQTGLIGACMASAPKIPS